MESSSSYKFLACPNALMYISLRENRVKGREWRKGKRQREKREREKKKKRGKCLDGLRCTLPVRFHFA